MLALRRLWAYLTPYQLGLWTGVSIGLLIAIVATGLGVWR